MASIASIGRHRLVELECGLLRETRDQGATDPGGRECGSRRGQPAWQLPVGRGPGPSWASSMHAFPPLGSHPAEIHEQDNRKLPVLPKSVLGEV